MNTMDYEEIEESRLNYLARKYGRLAMILSFLMLLIFEFTGVRSSITTNISNFSSSDNAVAIQGSKKVNPSITGEYWTSNKFDF